MTCLYVLIPSSKCFTVGWKCSNLSFGLKAAILKLSQKLKGLSRRLHVLLNKNPRSVKMENLVNLRLCETKIQLQSKSLWELIIFHCLYYYSDFIQTPAFENHSQNTPWPSQNPRENKESIWLTKIITAGHVPLCVGKCVYGSSLKGWVWSSGWT